MGENKCLRCGGEFEQGFIALRANGEEEREEWGTGINFLGTGLNKNIPVTTLRCKNCGLLESFAK